MHSVFSPGFEFREQTSCTMKAATCALMVLVLHAVSNHRCVNGEISVATIEGFIEQGLDLVAKIQGLTSSDGVGNLLAQISDLSERIESIERNSMVQNQLNFDKLPQLLHTRTLMADHLRYLNKQLIGISRRYGDLKEFADGTTTYEDFTLIDFATNCVSPGDGVPRTLEKLNSLVIPEKDSFKNHDVLRRLADYLQVSICSTIFVHVFSISASQRCKYNAELCIHSVNYYPRIQTMYQNIEIHEAR